MVELESYLQDGANWQAKAVLAYLQSYLKVNTIDRYYNEPFYDKVNFQVGRFENCREQGYVLMVNIRSNRVANYAFFEHRNSDDIVVFKSDCYTINTPGIDQIYTNDRGKHDYDASFRCGEIELCAKWIIEDIAEIVIAAHEEYVNENH